MLGLLSIVNWLAAGLYALAYGIFLVTFADKTPFFVTVLLLPLIIGHGYVGTVIDKGRGVQTALAVLGIFNFPVGTIVWSIALWIVWSAEREVFDRGGIPDEPTYDEAVDDDSGLTPYAMAKAMKSRGVASSVIRTRLDERGLDREEIVTLLNAIR